VIVSGKLPENPDIGRDARATHAIIAIRTVSRGFPTL